MIFYTYKSPHTLVESLACKQIGTSSKVNLKLQICQVIYRVILLGAGVRSECFGWALACFYMNRKQGKASGSVPAQRKNETETVGYCPACKDIHSLQEDTVCTQGTSVKTIAVLVDCALSIFKSSCAFNCRLSGLSSRSTWPPRASFG